MTHLAQLLGTWQRPPDGPAWAALAAAGVVLVVGWTLPARRGARGERAALSSGLFLTFVAFAAAFLSLGYVAHYLRGGPRIIDATSYFLQGRALSHGGFTFHAPEVSASFRGRFLLFHEPGTLAGIFPPGYPLLLALGFKLGAPMVIGPVLAAALAVATYAAARELAQTRGPAGAWSPRPDAEAVARVAALLSLACAALRYHTADTMAHGATALAVTVAFACALSGQRTGHVRAFALAGLMVGWAASTRTVSALPIGVVVGVLAWTSPRRPRALAAALAATVPGLALLAAANVAATGSAAGSAQLAYYAASDGPPGCFRYGFGRGVGCLFEHGDFVQARLAGGYGLTAALGTTLRRLHLHLTDVANLEPLALLVLAARTPRARLGQALVFAQVLAYAPFYFDGNYPGGGARFFADVLPVEHALVALAVAELLPRVAFARRAAAVLALSLAGFAVHASFGHVALAARDGGRPMFEPDRVREANVTAGVLFLETDHGWNLAHDPDATPAKGLVAARLRGDDHDRLLVARLGNPPANVYAWTPSGAEPPTITRFTGSTELSGSAWRFETEADWPPLMQRGGWAAPEWVAGGRVLTLRAAEPPARARAVVELPIPRAGRWRVQPAVVHRGSRADAVLRLYARMTDASLRDREPRATWSWRDGARDQAERLPEQLADLEPPSAILEVETNEAISIDYVTLVDEESAY